VNVAHTDRIIEGLRFVFVELPKFKPKTIAEKKMTVLWLRFLTEIDEDTVEASSELLENEATRKALSIVEKSAMTEGQLYAYEKFWRAVIDEEVHFRVHYQDGFDKGMVKGRAEGREEGRAEGRAEERIKNARSLKANGIPLDTIASSLGLSQDEIEELTQNRPR
jgi:predicted transposase/invertase (TIGR01784 family)